MRWAILENDSVIMASRITRMGQNDNYIGLIRTPPRRSKGAEIGLALRAISLHVADLKCERLNWKMTVSLWQVARRSTRMGQNDNYIRLIRTPSGSF